MREKLLGRRQLPNQPGEYDHFNVTPYTTFQPLEQSRAFVGTYQESTEPNVLPFTNSTTLVFRITFLITVSTSDLFFQVFCFTDEEAET